MDIEKLKTALTRYILMRDRLEELYSAREAMKLEMDSLQEPMNAEHRLVFEQCDKQATIVDLGDREFLLQTNRWDGREITEVDVLYGNDFARVEEKNNKDQKMLL